MKNSAYIILLDIPLLASCSYPWGALADRKGRKSVLIVSNVLMAVFSVAFGFSVNFPMAVLLRFFTGLSNGGHREKGDEILQLTIIGLTPLPPSLPPSLPHSLPPSLPSSLPPSLSPSLPPSLLPSRDGRHSQGSDIRGL